MQNAGASDTIANVRRCACCSMHTNVADDETTGSYRMLDFAVD